MKTARHALPVFLFSAMSGSLLAAPSDLDTSFADTGTLFGSPASSLSDTAEAVVQQADGKLVVAGTTPVGSDVNGLVLRYNLDGLLDTTFNGTGIVSVKNDQNAGKYLSRAVIQQADGKLVVAGTSSVAQNDFFIMRLNTDGTLDTSFSGDGRQATDIAGGQDQASDLIQLDDGSYVVVGMSLIASNADFGLVRYGSDGSFVTQVRTEFYNSGGWGCYDTAYSVVQLPDGKLIVAGTSSFSSNDYAVALARYDRNGGLDTSFNGTGKVRTTLGTNSAVIHGFSGFVLLPDGKFLVGADGDNGLVLVRYNSDGTLDTTFNATGKLETGLAGAKAMIRQADGKLAVLRSVPNPSYTDFALTRLNSDGSLDSAFNGTGTTVVSIGTGSDTPKQLIQQKDGKLFAVGTGRIGTGYDQVAMMRVLGDPLDTDGDGVIDDVDAFPLDPAESVDTDHDGIGNNADHDDDSDGVPDAIDSEPLDPAVTSEVTLPLDAGYKGSAMKESAD